MSEEEKKAIETANDEYFFSKNKDMSAVLDYEDLGTLLNLIQKLQKENEELKEKNEILREELKSKIQALDVAMSNPDYIPKDKIRDFIKRLEKDVENIREKKKDSHDYDRSSSRIQAYLTKTNEIIKRLKELLEEEYYDL